jgi:predicted  nucleic acid-binding Zn-ribbon protein
LIENFKVIKEIDSLDRQKKDINLKAQNQSDRIISINQKITDKEDDLASLKADLKEITSSLMKMENELSNLQQKIEIKISQKGQVFTETQINSLDKEIESYQKNLITTEELVFKKMEIKESFEEEIKDCLTFIQGATKSSKEVQIEVEGICLELNQKKQIIDERIENLIATIPENFKTKVKLLLVKNFRSTILTTIKDKACNYCRCSIASGLINEIEDKYNLKSCTGCKRIFIPSASSY